MLLAEQECVLCSGTLALRCTVCAVCSVLNTLKTHSIVPNRHFNSIFHIPIGKTTHPQDKAMNLSLSLACSYLPLAARSACDKCPRKSTRACTCMYVYAVIFLFGCDRNCHLQLYAHINKSINTHAHSRTQQNWQQLEKRCDSSLGSPCN